MWNLLIAWLAVLAGTLGYGIGSVLQAHGARRASGMKVMVQPTYLAGVACDLLAWVCSIVALQRLPLFAVQAVLAGSLAVTVLVARLFLGATMLRRDTVAIAAIVGSLVVVGLASGAEAAVRPSALLDLALLLGLVLVGGVTAVIYQRGHPLILAALSGLAFSGAAIGARVLNLNVGAAALVASPALWLIAGAGLLGMVGYARALEKGAVGPATAVLWVVEVMVPGIIGVAWLGDGVRAGWGIPAVLAVCVAVLGSVVVAFSPAQQA